MDTTNVPIDNQDLDTQAEPVLGNESLSVSDNIASAAIRGDLVGFNTLLGQLTPAQQPGALNDALISVLDNLYASCGKLLDQWPIPEEPATRLSQLRDFFSSAQNRQGHSSEASVFLNHAQAIQLISKTRAKLLLPKSIKALKSLYETRYLNILTYADAKSDLSFIKKLIDALPEEQADTDDFYQKLADFLSIKANPETDPLPLIPKIIRRLYRLEILDNLLLDHQQDRDDNSPVPPTQELFNEQSEETLLLLAMFRDKIYQDSLANEAGEAAAINQTNLDVA